MYVFTKTNLYLELCYSVMIFINDVNKTEAQIEVLARQAGVSLDI